MIENKPLLESPFHSYNAITQIQPNTNVLIPDRGKPHFFGYIFMIIASIGFASSGFFVRIAESSYGIPSNETFFVMTLTAWISLIPFIVLKDGLKNTLYIKKEQVMYLILRSIFGTASGYSYVKAMNLAPLGDVAAAYNICPAITLILAFLFLNEKIRKVDILSLSLSSIGVFLITRSSDLNGTQSHQHFIGTFLAVLSGTMAAISYTIIRHLKDRIHFITPAFFFLQSASIFGAFVGLPSIKSFINNGLGFFSTILAGLSLALAQVSLNIGFQKCPVGRATIFRNIEIPLEYFLGLAFLNEVPTLQKIFAVLLIITSTVMLALRKAK